MFAQFSAARGFSTADVQRLASEVCGRNLSAFFRCLRARRFRAAGIPEAGIHIVGPDLTHRNLVLRYRGTGAKPPVVLLAHLDVVEAKQLVRAIASPPPL